MSISCPACNKSDQTGPVCARCGCDLSLLHSILASAEECLGTARAALRDCDWPSAQSWASRAWRLHHSAAAARLACLAAAAAGDTPRTILWHTRATERE